MLALQTRGGAALLSSPAAREGDFAKLARQQFGVKALQARLADVIFVLQGVSRRALAADSVYGRIDTTRVAIAGFDLGAQTALAFAGEKDADLPGVPALPGLRAVIALSPQAILARGGFAQRFGGIHLPVLSITGSEDADPYGLVDSPHTRQAPFAYMPPGDKLLLIVEDGTHQLLAGGKRAPNGSAEAEGPPSGESRQGGGGRREAPGGMGRGGGPGGSGGPGGAGGPGGSGGREGPAGAARSPRSGGQGTQRQKLIVERVSLAFLDAVVKDDPVAREWLARDAVRWSDPLARLKAK